MPSADGAPHRRRNGLIPLRDRAVATHDDVLRARALPGTSTALVVARAAHLDALGDYVQALTDLALPVPGPLRDELRLLRALGRRSP